MVWKCVRRVGSGLLVFHAGDIELDGAALSVCSALPSQSPLVWNCPSQVLAKGIHVRRDFFEEAERKTHTHMSERLQTHKPHRKTPTRTSVKKRKRTMPKR